MDITLKTKIYDLITKYPFLEDELIKINPKFKKLKNPILKRTIARVASIKQAALVGGMEPVELLNKIRAKLNLEPLYEETKSQKEEKAPSWINEKASITLNANKLLDEEKNPLKEIFDILKESKKGEIIVIESDFLPAPLIDALKKKNIAVYAQKINKDLYKTYIRK